MRRGASALLSGVVDVLNRVLVNLAVELALVCDREHDAMVLLLPDKGLKACGVELLCSVDAFPAKTLVLDGEDFKYSDQYDDGGSVLLDKCVYVLGDKHIKPRGYKRGDQDRDACDALSRRAEQNRRECDDLGVFRGENARHNHGCENKEGYDAHKPPGRICVFTRE